VLEEQLRGSIPAARVVAIDGSEEAAGRIIAEKPALVLFDIGEDPTWAVEAVQMLSGAHELGCARIAAMVTPQPDRSERALEGRGFDAVLAKPVHVSEIERLLGAS
jgi:CheY-like chemotaxis protein